jgi:uracil-DNA glycosylase family 4
VDAREQLRRYLEQRRDMGETELVLDSLTVEEALRMVSGSSASRGPEAEGTARAVAATVDWREMLRAAGGEPAPREPMRGADRFASVARGDELRADLRQTPRVESPSSAPAVDSLRPRAPDTPPAPPPLDIPAGITVGSEARELFGGPLAHLDSVSEIARAVRDCTRCPLYREATNPVPGEGPAQARVMVVGEAPGANEDATGRPFVGPAGQLLTKILASVDLRREDVFICNVMKHRPPGNRNPTPDEVAACSPYLVRQIELIKPKVILALGNFAAQTLLGTKLSIGKLRCQLHRYHGVPLIVTYHPAALLRNPGWKRPTWEDVQLARRVLDRAAGAA